MKRRVVLCAGVLMLALIPGLASAQGWLLPGLPSLPSFGGSGCGSCYGNLGGMTIGGDVAYVGYSKSASVDFVAQGPGIGGIVQWRQGFPVHGIQLSGIAAVSPSSIVTLFGRGTWLLPWNGESFEEYRPLSASRNWSTSQQWWTAEGAGAYWFSASAAILGGLRYDSFMINFKDPSDVALIAGLPGDEADFQLSAWIPFGGVLVQQGAAKFGVIGFPWVPATVRYRQTIGAAIPGAARISGSGSLTDGYFFEAFAEFGVNLMGATAGLFVKWTVVHGRSSLSMDENFNGLGFASDTFQLSLDRQNWILGAQATLNFRSPF